MSQYAVKGTAATDAPVADLTDVDVSSLKPVVACCCFISSLFCKFPECLGCKSEAKILCWQQEVVCCKPITVKNADDKLCQLTQTSIACIRPSGCCTCSGQYCCLDSRGSCPPNDESPCLFTLLPFCIVAADYGLKVKCCGKIGDVIERAPEALPSNAASQPQPVPTVTVVNINTGAPDESEMER